MAQALGSTVNKWDLMKPKNFCKVKDTVNRTNQQPTDWKRILAISISDKGLIYKELKKLDTSPVNPIKTWCTEPNTILNREISKGREALKGMFNVLGFREMQTK
jgi:predicted GTPase